MSAASWACAALLSWHLSFAGALPKELPADAYPARQQVRILICDQANALQLRPTTSLAIEDAEAGSRLAVVSPNALVTLRASGKRVAARARGLSASAPRLLLRPLDPAGAVALSSDGGWGKRGSYAGLLGVSASSHTLRIVQQVDLEVYLAGVVAAEMPSSFPLEAMKAQAIAARTYALYHLGAHADDGADLCAQVHCQAYAGQPPASASAAQAARQTAGQVLTYNGLLIDALYHSACGGATAPAWQVRQGKLLPYLRGSSDLPLCYEPGPAYCSLGHDITWSKRFSYREAQRLVSSNLGPLLGSPGLSPGRLLSVQLVAAPENGRAAWLAVETTTGTFPVRGDAIRWLFGAGQPGPAGLRSTALRLTVEHDSRGRPTAFLFQGVGHGHGIGLCQWGARGRALSGQTAEEILSAYYPGAVVVALPDE